ncbi:hypothetical protein BsWGS_08986 [Bradybaena similaris]
MDRWLSKGNPQSSLSSEGAFERFLTAAIATIITIIFSWRMLDTINEEREEDENEPERHKLGHTSSLSQTSSFVSLASSPPQERTTVNYFSREETSRFRSQFAESHGVASLSERAARGDFNTGGFRFQLETIIRVPVDFPLCGDSPERPTRVQSAKISEHAEVTGIPGESTEARGTDAQLLDCFIDRASPGAGQVGDTQQQHDLAITNNRSVALLQATDGLGSRAQRQTSYGNYQDINTSTTNRNSISDSSLEYIPNDVTDITDSSIEEAGYTCNDNSDLFLNASDDDDSGDDDRNDKEHYQDISVEEENTAHLHTTDDIDSDDPHSDDYFIALSDGDHHHFDQGYDFDDDVQPRELDSDEELFCCSILEPIIEEDSDDITTSSEGDNSRSEKSSHKRQYDVNVDVPSPDESDSPETPTDNFASSANFGLDINQDDAINSSNEPNREVPDRKCVPEVTTHNCDPNIACVRLQNVNTALATDPDYDVRIGRATSPAAHSALGRAELFSPAVNNRANESSVPKEDRSEYIRWFGSSVDRFFSNAVIEQTQEANRAVDLDNCLQQTHENNTVDDTEEDSIFDKQFASTSFMHTFSTRVEVEDSNSESDESVQTVISRRTNSDLEGSPQHVSYLTSGLRTAQETNKRPYSDGVLYSSKRRIDEESRDVAHRLRNVSDGGGVAFGEEESSTRFTVDSIPGRSHFNLPAYKSFTAEDLPTLTDEKFDSKLDIVPEFNDNDFTPGELRRGEFSNIDFGQRVENANKHGGNHVVIGTAPEARLFESEEPADQTDNGASARQMIILDSEKDFEPDVNHQLLGKVTLQGDVITGLTESQFVYSNLSQDSEDTRVMDSGRVSYSTEEKSRYDDSNELQDDDDEEWQEEVVETFVLPLSHDRSFVTAMQNMQSILEKSGSGRGSQVLLRGDDDEEKEYQSTCLTTMIEVEGYGARGFTQNADVTSGYRDQFSELERADRDVKGKMGFKLNLDEYKSDEYVTESGWPVTRYTEKERVFIDESVPNSKFRKQDENTFGNVRGRYAQDDLDNNSDGELATGNETKERHEHMTNQQQEDEEEEEENYVEEHIEVFRMKNFQFGSETFEPQQTRPVEFREDYSDRSFPKNRSPVDQPSSWREYTLFGTTPNAVASSSPVLPEMASADSLYTSLSETIESSPRGDEQMYSPYTNTSYKYSDPFSQNSSRNVLTQNSTRSFPPFAENNAQQNNSSSQSDESISRNKFTEGDTQRVPSFMKSAQQENAPSSNYDDFVRHILAKAMEDDPTKVISSKTGSILSGNVAASQTPKTSIMFPSNENTQQANAAVRSPTFSTQKFNTERDEVKREDIPREQDVKKPTFVRTSTAQDEDELLKFKPNENKHSSSSLEGNRLELEGDKPWSSGISRHSSRAGDNEIRTRAAYTSPVGTRSPRAEYTDFPTTPRLYQSSEACGEPRHDKTPGATPPTSRTHQMNISTAEDLMTKYSVSESPSVKPPSPVWTRVIAGSNFLEEKSIVPTESEPSSSSDHSGITVSNRTTQPTTDRNALDNPIDVELEDLKVNPVVKPFYFTQSTISLTSTLNTMPTASSLTKESATSHTDKVSERKAPQQSPMPTSSEIKMPLVSSSATKLLQERTPRSSTLDRNDRYNLAQPKSEEFKTKGEVVNTKEESHANRSSSVYYKGGNTDIEQGDMNNKETKIATIKNPPIPSETTGKSYSVESADDLLPQDSSSASGTASPVTSFDSGEPSLASTQYRLLASATSTPRPVPPKTASLVSDSSKKPKTLKEIKKRHKQPYKSVLTQDAPAMPLPKAAPFVVPDHLITPSRMKILQARNAFLSEQNLHTDPFDGEFTVHKESLGPNGRASVSKERQYTPRMSKQPNYRSQEQLEKIQYMVSLKPGRSEGSLNVDCLHDDCIFSEAGRREIMDKTLSIDNLDARLHSHFGNLNSHFYGPMSDAFDPETNSDLFDLTFQIQDEFNRQLDRPASMGELRHASDYTTISGSGAWGSSGSRYQDHFSQKQNKKSKSLGTLEIKEDDDDFETSTRADGLHRPPSAHELRISKSLQKLNVPDWYKHVSVTKSGSFLPRCRSAFSVASRGTSASLASSPSTTPSTSSNVIIKSRVQFPTTSRNLRSPYAPSKSAPTTPSLASWEDGESKSLPTPVRLPSESMRTADKPKALMPIPILPLDRIRFIVERKKELARVDKMEVNRNMSSSITQSSTVPQPQTVPAASVSPTDSFDINCYNEDENPEDVIPEVIVSPTDPNVRSILKKSTNEKKGSDVSKPVEAEAEYPLATTDHRKVQEFAPTLSLFQAQAPVYFKHSNAQPNQQILSHAIKERPLLVEEPSSIDIQQTAKAVNNSELYYDAGEEERFITQNKEKEWRSLPVAKPREQHKSLRSSSSSSTEEIKSKPDMLQYSTEQQQTDTSFDSPDVFPETQHNSLSADTSMSPPTIIVTPDTPRPTGSHYVNVVVVEPKNPVAFLERATVIRPPENKPFIAPVIEDHSITDTPPYFTEYSTEHIPRTWSSSPESIHESDLNQSFNRPDIPSKPVQTQVEPVKKRTWVPKPKPNRKFKSSKQPENDITDSRYTNTSALQSKPWKHESVDTFQYDRSPVESESQEESTLSEESPSENLFVSKDRPVMYYSQVPPPATREVELERSYDSYSSRSTYTSQSVVPEDPDELGALNRRPMTQSNASFSRSLDQVLDHYSTQDDEQPDDASERDTGSSTPTEDPNRSFESVRERQYAVSNGITNISESRHTEYINEYDFRDAHNYINGTLKHDRQRTDNNRPVLDYVSHDREYDTRNYDKSDIHPGNVHYGRTESDYEESEQEYSRRDRIMDRNDSPGPQASDITTAQEDLAYSEDSEQDSIRDYTNYSSTPGVAARNWTMPSNWTMPTSSKSHMNLSEEYEEPAFQRKPGRTWQPKPKRGRAMKHSVVKHAFSTGDIINRSSVASTESKVSPETSPYKYKVAGSAFSSIKPDARAGLTTPPSDRRGSSFTKPALAGTYVSSDETTV